MTSQKNFLLTWFFASSLAGFCLPQFVMSQQNAPIVSNLSDESFDDDESDNTSDEQSEDCKCKRRCELEPWKLFKSCRQEPMLNMGGWFSFGYHSQSNDLFNSHPDRWNLQQGWFFAEKQAKAGKCGEMGFGFRFDGIYGVDGPDTQAFANPGATFDLGSGFTRGGGYGWALPQVYGEVAAGDWNVKIGHFYTLVGYEVVTAPDNFFYSHAITMYNSEPFTHTGVIASKSLSDETTLYGGWTAGWDTGFDFSSGSNFLGGISTALSDDVQMTWITTIGDFGVLRGDDGYMQSLVFDVAVTDNLNYILQSDYLRVDSSGEDNVGINQYLIYSVNECLGIGSRLEWWKGDVLTGYAPHGGVLPASGSLSYYAATFGINVKPTPNLTIRPEYRYDWSPGAGYDEGYFGIDFVSLY